MAGGVFVGLSQALLSEIDNLTSGKTAEYASMIGIIVTSSITLYMMVGGYQVMAGKKKVDDVFYEYAKMAFILVFVTNAGGYLDLSIAAINGLKDGVSGDVSVWALLDSLWEKTQQLADTLYKLGDEDWVNVRGAIALCIIWGGAIITMITSAFTFLSADITIKLMTLVSPIFIFCLMFGFLRQMFNNWLQNIFSSILTLLFASLVLKVGINYLNDKVVKATALSENANIVTLSIQVLIIYIAAAFLVWLSAKIATQLAGVGVEGAIQGAMAMGVGASVFGASRLAKGGAGAMISGAKGGIEGGKGVKWANRENKGGAALLGYGSGRVGRAAIQKVKARNQRKDAA
ncbi:type IV secretion system protein [Pantoea endophytica]|uniref:Type IV secretion system protein n=1 Tax=Pantoea sp. BJ2 TaxID=3141322 RepID=A0AAU7U580_9GAMM